MWGALSRIFYKKQDKFETSNEETIMDKGEGKRVQECDTETHATRQVSEDLFSDDSDYKLLLFNIIVFNIVTNQVKITLLYIYLFEFNHSLLF